METAKPKKEDRRVRYTKQAIRDGFLRLLAEKPIEKISVTEICREADINRGTFYAHYSDPYELKRSLEDQLSDALAQRLQESGLKRLTSLQTLRLLSENRELCRVFAGPYGDHDAMLKVIAKHADDYLEQEILMHDLKGEKTAELKAAIEDGVPVLAICGGYQMLGQYYKTWDGQQCDFTGALDLYTVGSEQRMIGNYMFSCEEAGCNIVGFENHSGKTYLGAGVKPMGKVLAGFGNNGEDGTEGARYKNVFGTYSHGSLLPKNPKLADHILRVALERKYGEAELTPLDDSLETAAHDYMKRRLEK